MKTRGLFFMLLFVGLVAAVLFALLVASREPVYQGKKLSAWLKALPQGPIYYRMAVGVGGNSAENAIRQIGTNAIPLLLKEIHAKDSAIGKVLMRWAAKQSLFKVAFQTAESRRERAVAAFIALGPAADAAIPALVGLLDDPEPVGDIELVLIQYGPKVVLPVTQGLTNRNESVRIHAVAFMERCPAWFADSERTVSDLVNGLADRSFAVRERAAHALGLITRNAAFVVPALTKALMDSNASVRATAAWALSEFGAQAESAIPALSKSLRDQDKAVRDCATYALEHIRPAVAGSVGGK